MHVHTHVHAYMNACTHKCPRTQEHVYRDGGTDILTLPTHFTDTYTTQMCTHTHTHTHTHTTDFWLQVCDHGCFLLQVYDHGIKDSNLKREPEKPKAKGGWRYYDSVQVCQPPYTCVSATCYKHVNLSVSQSVKSRPTAALMTFAGTSQNTGIIQPCDTCVYYVFVCIP